MVTSVKHLKDSTNGWIMHKATIYKDHIEKYVFIHISMFRPCYFGYSFFCIWLLDTLFGYSYYDILLQFWKCFLTILSGYILLFTVFDVLIWTCYFICPLNRMICFDMAFTYKECVFGYTIWMCFLNLFLKSFLAIPFLLPFGYADLDILVLTRNSIFYLDILLKCAF